MNPIKEILKNKRISQAWLARPTAMSYNTINEYARKVRQPRLEDLYTIAEILNVEVKDLLTKRRK